eukprot:TRINITY_DN28627_c0_g1_i1.p1 TRINITY_DN28627_c0_g1~~TRINITY_DN28627_c0_g1_i1.p1  ORF type:complete len:281 (-),score=121.28 TRINITY_DN28627_c0_g1_i1:67-909(-)
MDIYLLIAVATFLCVLLAVPTFLRFSGSSSAPSGGGQQRAVEANRGPGGRRGPRIRRPVRGDSDDEDGDDADRNEELEELEEAGVKIPDGKIGKKKLEKLQAKADKKLQREAELREREEAKKRREKDEEEAKKARDKEAEEEKRQAEEEKRIKEEKERKEYEEYLKLKEAFTVDEEGCDENGEDSEENRLAVFINHIKEKKVVLLEDLAAHFKIKTQEVIDRISSLQESGDLTGVVDDRGKFIYVSREELDNVAKFIRQQGRVSITDLAANSNKLITLAS